MGAEESPKAGLKRKIRTRILKSVLALVVVVILLVVFVVPGFVSSERGRKIILAKINSSIDGEIDFARSSMSWFKGIKVTDFSFNDNAGGTCVQVKQITTKPHYGSILMGNLSFGQTIIDKPNIKINLKATQITEAPQQRIPPDEKPRVALPPIKKIDLIINDGDVKVTDHRARIVELSQINSKVNLQPPGQQTNFDINLAVVDGGKESKISATGWMVPERWAGWSLKGTSGDLTVEVNDLELGSLGPIFALGGIEVQAEGRVSGNIESEIKNGRLERLSAEVEGRDLDVNAVELIGGRFKTSRLGINVKLARAQQMINIESFDIDADWLKAEGCGTVPTTFSSLGEFLRTDSSLSGRFELDVAQIFTQMPGTFGLKEGIKVTSGMLRGDIETLTEVGKRKISGQANLEGLEGMVAGKTIALSEPVRAEVEITSDKGGIKFDKLDLSSAFATINCSGTSELFGYRGNVNLAKLQAELGQFVDIKRYEMVGELSGEGEVSIKEDKVTVGGLSAVKNLRLSSAAGVITFEPTADIAFSVAVGPDKNILEPENVSAKAKLGFAKAEYMGLHFGPTEVDIQIENGLLRIAPFSSAVNNGQFNFAGEANFKQKPTLLKTPGPIQVVKDIQINERIARRLLMYLNPVFANAVKASGVANFDCEELAIPLAGAAKNDIEVIGTISIRQLRLEASDLLGQILSVAGVSGRGVDITIRPTRFILQNGLLRYDDMQMIVGDNPVNFGGVIGLDKSLNMTVTLPYTTKGETVRIGKEAEGVRISLPLRGTIDKPELDLGKLLEEQLKQQLKERLKEELDKLFKK